MYDEFSVTLIPLYIANAINSNTFLFSFSNTLRPRRNGRHFTDDIFKCIFLHENVWIPIWISLKFVPKGPINNIPALVQIMAWCRPGDKPLSEPMMVRLPTHIYVNRPQWVKVFVIYIGLFVCFLLEGKPNWGLVCQKQVLRVCTNNYISQYLWGVFTFPCNTTDTPRVLTGYR